jgi:hypothetical protein
VQSSYPCSIAYQASVDEPFEKRMLLLRQLRQDALIEGNYHTLESEFLRSDTEAGNGQK